MAIMRRPAKKSNTPQFTIRQRWPDVPRCEHPGCAEIATHGFGRSVLRDQPGRTFCRLHAPEDLST